MPAFVSKLPRRLRRPSALVEIDGRLWADLVDQLARRGRGERESGAFLLGDIRPGLPRRVRCVVYYDDLDEDCLTGGITFDGAAYGRLWDICAEKELQVAADVHTHPGPVVMQSGTDRDHPMIARARHVGLILPNYATGAVSPARVGVHLYLGDGAWESFLGSAARRRLKITRRRRWAR